MSWRDRYQDSGSFRGVPFLIERASLSGGRRGPVHEYPLRDTPWKEDLGRAARRYTVQCYVLGPDYDIARDRLIAELEKSGPGTLVHPNYGTLQVACPEDGYTVETSTREGGIARFRINFMEAGSKREPDSEDDTAAVVDGAATAATEAAAAEFSETFFVAQRPAWLAQAATDKLQGFTDACADLRGRITSITAGAADFIRSIDAFSNEASALIRSPFDLAADITDLVGQVAFIVTRPIDALNFYRSLSEFGNDDSPVLETTATRQLQAKNQAAVNLLVQRAAVIEAARLSSTLALGEDGELRDARQANALRVELAEKLEAAVVDAGYETYAAVMHLRATVVRDLGIRAARLPRVVSIAPEASVPSLVLAHRLYGDARRETEFLERNVIRRPSFVPGGEPLEVLSD